MVFKELDVVRLKNEDHEAGVKTSFTGTVVDVLAEGVYTVEFFDDKNETVMPALHKVYYESELELVKI